MDFNEELTQKLAEANWNKLHRKKAVSLSDYLIIFSSIKLIVHSSGRQLIPCLLMIVFLCNKKHENDLKWNNCINLSVRLIFK